jgi:hypothetical protein
MARKPSLEALAADVNRLNARVVALMAHIAHLERTRGTSLDQKEIEASARAMLPAEFSLPSPHLADEIHIAASYLSKGKPTPEGCG